MKSRIADWLSAQEAAERLHISRPRIHQLVRAGTLVGTHIAGRLLIQRRSLEAWASSRRRAGRPTSPMTLKRLRSKRVAIQKIAATHGARTIRVFGSVARGDARLASDIDFLVDMEPGRNALDLSELAVDLEEELGRPVAVVEIRRLSSAAAALQANALRL